MKILVVSSYLPYPLFSGGHVRLFNLLKELSTRHEITLVCEKRKHQSVKDVAEVKKICKEVFTIDRKKQWSPGVVFKTAISSYPFLLAGHDVPEMKKIITKLLAKKKFDLIHIETFYVYHNLPETSLPTVLVEHNIEYKVYERFATSAPIFVKPLLKVDTEKIRYWEEKSWHDVTEVVGVSEIEAKQMRNDAHVVPNGVNLVDFPFIRHEIPDTPTILFMGDFKWIQNINTALWILKEIWPKIKEKNKEQGSKMTLWIVGKHIPESIKKFGSDTVVIDEHAPDKTSDIYKKADILLSPIRVGGGTSYKILEAMASGVPVVTTQLGIEGLKTENNTHALIGESPDDFVAAVSNLISNENIYSNIAKNAREFIEKYYSWKEIAKTLEGVYNDAVKK